MVPPSRRPLSRRRFLSATAAGLWLAGGVRVNRAEDDPVPPRVRQRAGVELITPETKTAIERALSFLVQKQIARGQQRGAFGTAGYAAGVAVCGLAGLAFLSSGSAPGRGKYGQALERCLDYLIANTDANGYISAQAQSGTDRMYGHGFATLFLAEAYGMGVHADREEVLGKKLRAAVQLIINTQNDQGGWRYQPVKSDADLSITICQIMALRAARDAGLDVPAATRTKCIDYVKKSHGRDGGFMYTLGGGHTSFALTAAGVVALNSAGIYDGKEVESALAFCWRQKPTGSISGGYFFYSQYYAAQAMWHAGGTYWSGWYPAIRDLLVRNQSGAGTWMDPGVGEEFGTAMGLIILQLPYNYVPVFGEG
ncbi:MAG TPA: prenyltransferase/squalene oxidase repeat-containing protein [Planctomycetaceae bacterium]|nr:prenyltransferase/squalene oxidase repeat-containing protein [Planctomycetaceae bacterium]